MKEKLSREEIYDGLRKLQFSYPGFYLILHTELQRQSDGTNWNVVIRPQTSHSQDMREKRLSLLQRITALRSRYDAITLKSD